MNETWRVKQVILTEGRTTAELVPTDWFKPVDPDDELTDYDVARPGDEGADFIEIGDRIVIEVAADELRPGDDVLLSMTVVSRATA